MAWVDIYDGNSTYSYPTATWTSAKETAKRSIVRNLHNPNVVFTTYGDLVNELRPLIDFGSPRNAVFHCLLGQISDDEEENGRGLLSALVVHKDDLKPGTGFYEGAAAWGRDMTDPERCWAAEVSKLQKQWT